jgi:membrane peptidoglycan carboxypeptidase
MAKTKPRNRVKGVASRGFFRRGKWIWIVLLVLLLIPAMQVAVVRFVDPPRTLPMWIDQVSSSGTKAQLRNRWIPLAQIPEMFLKHLWISEDQRFFQHERFGRSGSEGVRAYY